MITAQQVREELRKACREAGSQQAWAERHDLSASYVTDVLMKRKEPGKSILDALGYERVVRYGKRNG